MTGRTHDLAAFTALTLYMVYQPIPQMSLATAFTAFGGNMIGGLLPDIDDAGADIWDKIRGGSILGKIIKPLIGGHRMISHSLFGMAIIGFILDKLLMATNSVFIVDTHIVWWSVMLGYLSHLFTDSITKEGVPWLFPLPVRFGFPPLKKFRMKTDGIWEKLLVVPGLFFLNGYLFFTHYPKFLTFFRLLLVK